MEELKDFKMPYGKFKDQPLDEIPLRYLDYMISIINNGEVKDKLTEYLQDPLIARELEKLLGDN